MGMNNQFMANFGMDETAMKLKAIIAPYEKKISELEEKIKQKDFEILLLKEKLNNYEKSQFNMNNQIPIMNPMNINMNMNLNNNQMLNLNQMNMNNNQIPPMNLMNMNNFQNWKDQYNIMNNNNLNFGANLNNQDMMIMKEEEKIQINFLVGQDVFKEYCYFNEKNKNVFKRFCQKYGLNFKQHKFTYMGKKIFNNLTIAETGICDGSNISVINVGSSNKNSDNEDTDSDEEIYCIKFKTTNGKMNIIRGNPENSIGTIIKKYLKRIGRSELIYNKKNLKNEMVFIYNAQITGIDNPKKLNKFFFNDRYPTITVNDVNCLIAV